MSGPVADGSAGAGAGTGAAVSLVAGSTGPAAAAGRTLTINEATAMTSRRWRARGRVQDVRLLSMDREYIGSCSERRPRRYRRNTLPHGRSATMPRWGRIARRGPLNTDV